MSYARDAGLNNKFLCGKETKIKILSVSLGILQRSFVILLRGISRDVRKCGYEETYIKSRPSQLLIQSCETSGRVMPRYSGLYHRVTFLYSGVLMKCSGYLSGMYGPVKVRENRTDDRKYLPHCRFIVSMSIKSLIINLPTVSIDV